MDALRIEVIPAEKFEVKINGKSIGEFQMESSWEGLIKLRSPDGIIIASDDRGIFDKLFSGVLNIGAEPSFSVVKITPLLVPVGD